MEGEGTCLLGIVFLDLRGQFYLGGPHADKLKLAVHVLEIARTNARGRTLRRGLGAHSGR